MTTEIYTAPAGSGKTTFAIEQATLTSANLNNRVRVIVASSSQARMWQKRLAQNGGAIGVEVMIFDRMVAAILAEAGEAWTQLSEPVEYRLIRSLLDQLDLDYYGELSGRAGFVDVVQQLLPLLKSALIHPDDFQQAIADLSNEPRLKELGIFYSAYQTTLQKNSWADRVGLHWLALETLRSSGKEDELNSRSAVGSTWPLLIIDGFDDFTPAEIAIFTVLSQRVGRTVITLTQPLHPLPRYSETLEKLKRLANVTIQPLPSTISPTPLSSLANSLFSQQRLAEHDWNQSVQLVEATDRPTEIRAALRWLKQRIVQDGLSPADVALIARDISPYRPFIEQIGREFGLPIRIDTGRLLNSSPIINALLNLLRLHVPTKTGPELGRRQVVSLWRSPWFDWQQAGLKDLGALADSLDNLGRSQRVIGGLEQWSAAFDAQISAHDQTADLRQEDDEPDEQQRSGRVPTGTEALALKNSFDLFLEKTAPPPDATTFEEFVSWLEGLIGRDETANRSKYDRQEEADHSLAMIRLARSEPATGPAAVAALTRLKDVLRGLVWAEQVIVQNAKIDYATFFNELSGSINTAVFDLPIAKGQISLVATNINSGRGLRWQAVAVVGLSEGEFPSPIGEDPFLRDEDRKQLREAFGFELDDSTTSRERELFYEAVSRGQDRLLLTRPVIADNGAEWVASPYWEEVRKKTGVEPSKVSADTLLQLDEVASEVELLEVVAGSAGSNQIEALKKEIPAWPSVAHGGGILLQREAVGTYNPIVPNKTEHDGDLSAVAGELAERFGPEHVWSASRLEAMRQCGMLFYVANVLKVEPRPEPAEGLDVAQLGSLYHDIFEKCYGAGVPETSGPDEIRAFVAGIAGPILDTAPEQHGFRETAWWSQTKTDIIDNVTKSILELAQDNWTFLAAEASFGMQSAPLVIQRDGDSLKLRGFIDRIDQNEAGELRIIDYKLGGKTNFSQKAFELGEKLQLPLYALAVEQALNMGVVSDGFYWHFRQAEASPFTLGKYAGGPAQAAETAAGYAWQAVEQVRAGRFEPTPPEKGCPSWCPAAQWCWKYKPSNW
ncbi:MAG: ATP-dependent helicase/DNAse subunit B [Cellvibrionaceae bacterium]|jgi:ATP-dependent helicase/DNAse subunit B